ncbi:MAG TPA: hypothetical protein VFI65_13920 [Streptosporangiaceae bacterium]|nr:hypothetical protein [Streptosporangiaceae bacterium]
MSSFAELAQTLFDMFGPYWDDYQSATLDHVRDYLADGENPVIRMWVGAGPDPVIQSTTIGILRQLVAGTDVNGYGYVGTIEVIYAPGTDEDPTKPKLDLLLPELGGQDTGQVGDADVVLTEWDGSDVTDLVNLGFTGSAGNGPNFATRIGARYLLRLAPYLSGEPHQIQAAQGSTVDLTSPAMPGAATLRQRAYYSSPPAEPDWAIYEDGPYADVAAIIKLLTTTDGIGVLPVDAISSDLSPDVATPAVDRMFEVIASVLASQRDEDNQPAPTARGIAIVSCGTFGTDSDQEQLQGLLRGGYCAQERNLAALLEADEEAAEATEPGERVATSLDSALKGHQYRAEWLDHADAGSRVELLWSPDEDEVDGWVDWLAADGDHVLFIQLGTVPEPLFTWCLAQAAWPAVIERADETSLALNLGTAYFQVAKPGNQGIQYPPPTVGYDVFGGEPYVPRLYPTATGRLVQDAANQLSAPLWTWNPEPENNPAELAGALVRDYLGEDDDGPLHAYFASVADIYAGGIADKLGVGLAALRYTQAGRDDPASLQQLYTELTSSIERQRLPIAPGVFGEGSGIYDFYTEFLDGEDFVILAPTVTYNPDAVTVTGSVIFHGVPLTATIVFTAPQGTIVASASYDCTQSWPVGQIPWIAFGTPRLTIDTPDQLLAPTASAGGVVSGTSAPIAFRLPVAAGYWLLAADFAEDHADLEDFFTIAGGVDLIRSLPAPIDGLTGFGVSNAQLLYDAQAEELVFAGFRVGTSAGFTLIPGVEVQDVTADVVVHAPASLGLRRTDWVVRGTFTVGSGTVRIAATGPELEFTGTLESGVITLGALAGKFAPGVDVGDVPQPPLGAVTAFDAALTQASGDYEVSCQLNTEWSIGTSPAGDRALGDRQRARANFFSINDLGFTATSLSGVATGQVTGNVVVAGVVPLALSADYANGWTFRATQPAGQELPLDELVEQFTGWSVDSDFEIVDLGLVVAADGSRWEVSGRTAEFWEVPFIDGLSVLADFRAGRAQDRFFARVDTLWDWHGAEIVFFYDYDVNVHSFGLEWAGLEGLVTGPDAGLWTATLTFADTVTIGSIIETMVTWATGSAFALEAPWSFLNGIPLSNLSLKYTFSGGGTNQVQFSVDIGPIELGFGRIDSIGVVYDDEAERKVAVTLDGSFAWNTGDFGTPGTLGPWDASRPGDTPAPPGLGNKYVDVRMLALGQHVTWPGLPDAANVPTAIRIMSEMPEPSGDTLPTAIFDPAVGWIVGADLGFVRFGPDDGAEDSGYLVTAQFVFNDPRLYALRLALAGPAAKVFAGLDFQIMYRQISDSVGVYQGEIALPDAMRHLSIGGYSVTLPVFGVAVYTNGDFQIDVGFPWGGDFGRSFTVEGFVAPGIPVTGSAGFYFGKLSSATSDLVPKISNGTFSPVLTFGFGMQVGFGKSVSYGLLKAGFSVTAGGIIEGVLATFNPYQPAISGSASAAQLQDAYYFWLRGTFGIAGRLYGSVDFSVVKADVDVSFTLMLQITYEAYASLSMTVIVAVDVSVSVRIDVGFFTIRISMSFSTRVRETLTFDNGGSPPWIATGAAAARLAAQQRRLLHRQRPGAIRAAAASGYEWTWLIKAETPVSLYGVIAPAMTVARDENDAAKQLGCQVFLSFIKTVPPSPATLAEAISEVAIDTSFELFALMVARWAISTLVGHPITAAAIDNLVIAEVDLAFLLDVVLRSDDANPAPIKPAAIDTFMTEQFKMEFNIPPEKAEGTEDLTLFPMPPTIGLRVHPYGDDGTYQYVLGDYNYISDAGLAELRAYFDQLAIVAGEQQPAALAAPPGALSMVKWVQSDYFLLVARQMVQIMLDALRDYKYVLVPGQTMGGIVAAINAGGSMPAALAITIGDLFAANPTRPLRVGAVLHIGATVTVASVGGESFESLAVRAGVTAAALAQANAAEAGVLKAGAFIVYQGEEYPVPAGHTLADVAWHFGIKLGDLLSGATGLSGAAGLLGDPALLNGGATLTVPLITYQARSDSSFATIAGQKAYYSPDSGLTPEKVAKQNAGFPILRAGETVSYKLATYVIQPGDTLADAAGALDAPSVNAFLTGNDLLDRPRVLADVAVVALPRFPYKVRDDDTLEAIAARMATTVAVLAMAPGNANSELFTKTDTQPWIDVPHLPQFRVSLLLSEGRRTLGIHKLSAMVSRYGLHGTRLPTKDITPLAKGIWVKPKPGGGYLLPPKAGLYALTGQQVAVPALIGQQPFQVDLFRAASAPPWYQLTGRPADFVLTAATQDGQRLTAVLAAIAQPPNLGMQYLGAGAMTSSSPASYPMTVVADWQCPVTIVLPYGKQADLERVQALRLWTLPGALTALPDPRTPGKVAPRFEVSVASYDEATGGTVTTPVTSHGWASVVEFVVKRVPPVPGSPSTETTYEISGAGGTDVVVLERMVAEIGNDAGEYLQLVVGYPPEATTAAPTGIQTGNPAVVTFGIAQSNLSTDTRPPVGLAAAATAGTPGLLNSAPEFVRLLWQASITGAGGYYLYYFDAGTSAGLPARIFDDRGEATVSLLVVYAFRGGVPAGNRVRDYMTAVVTGDLIDTSASVVVATAAPMEPDLPSSSAQDLTLAMIAERSYSDVGDLAAANHDLLLETGLDLVVKHGIYQAPVNGISLTHMLDRYPMTSSDDLNAANPGLTWPLTWPKAIYLPQMSVRAGVDPGAMRLGELAEYYGVSLTRLAALNANVAGLFKQEQFIKVPGGPREQTALVPPGTVAVAAQRIAPPPPVPGTPSYGLDFVKNTFSLLSYQVWNNQIFHESNLGLPAGPVPPPQDVPASADKVRLAATSDIWELRQSVPYYRFMTPTPPTAPVTPYLGVGKLLQVAYGWQDYYGNTLKTTLDAPPLPPPPTGPVNYPPTLPGYTDQVLGISQWPSVSASYQVIAKPASEPHLYITLNFDTSRYQGAIKATVMETRRMRVEFTNDVDHSSVTTISNYQINRGVTILETKQITNRSCDLYVGSELDFYEYILQVTGIKGAGSDQTEYGGTITVPGFGQPRQSSSVITEAAQLDLVAYTTIVDQLDDPLGVAVTITSALLGQPVSLSASTLNLLRGWVQQIKAFLSGRASGQVTTLQASSHFISLPFAVSGLPAAQIAELAVAMTISRTGGVVSGELATTAAIRSATSPVPPLTTLGHSGNDPLGLGRFAAEFEQVLTAGGVTRKVAAGINRLTASAPDSGAALWMVKVGTKTSGQAISYSISPGQPALFAPRPLSNELTSRQHVPIRDYTTGVGLDLQAKRKLNFADVDLDVWGRILLGAVDELLAPGFTAPIQLVDKKKNKNYLVELLAQKTKLATAISKWMIPLYKGESISATDMQAAYYQQLLSRLSNAYEIKAGLQFTASVHADATAAGTTPPQLFGAVRDDAEQGLERSDITLTSPKLALEPSSDVPLPILMSAPDTVTVDGAVVGQVELALSWEPSAIEHQIGPVPGISTYQASSWLGFVLPDAKLDAVLGAVSVPIVLRAFPASPAVTGQLGEPTHANAADLPAVRKWTYEVTWTLPFHYVQDRVHGVVEFNVGPALTAQAPPDLFDALAEFVTVYPHVRADLDAILAPIDARTDSQKEFDDAAAALRAFIELLEIVNGAAAGPTGLAMPEAGPGASSATDFEFEVVEGADDGNLLVTIFPGAFPGVGTPVIDIAGYKAEPAEPAIEGGLSYIYESKLESGHYLSQAQGQQIADRTLVLPDLDVLRRQNAWASIWVTRNEQIIVGESRLADPFVYTTARTKFAEPILPIIYSSTVIDIARIGQVTEPTLEEYLTLLFETLFTGVPPEVKTALVGAEATYRYPLMPGADPVVLPVFFQPLLSVVISGAGPRTMAKEWSRTITNWRIAQAPVTAGARLHFDLTIFSSLQDQTMPLLRLRNLELAIADLA